MSAVTLNVELIGGSTPGQACLAMVDLANKLEVCIQARFNDVSVLAFPGDRALDLERSLNDQLSKDSKQTIKIAVAHAR